MKKQILPFITLVFFILSGCSQKLEHYPKNPNYAITKPKIKYTPSKKNLAKMVKELQGSPYVWAEEGPNNFDCSGFTYYLYGSMGIKLPRIARKQARVGKRISVNQLQYGDLIFFATNKRNSRKITHVGMYLGDGWFTHASTVKLEVIYSNLFTSRYYKNRLRVCRRYLPESKRLQTKVAKPWKAKKTIKKHTNTKQSTLKKVIVLKVPLNEIEQSSPSGTFYVQIGSYVGYPKRSIVYNITRQGFQHKIINFTKGEQHISRLLIGPYLTRKNALNALQHIRDTIKKDAFIAEIR